MDFELRAITEDEIPAFRTALAIGFGEDLPSDDGERFKRLMPLERTVAAFDGDDIVGTLGDFALELTVPGGAQLATAGTTMVTVRATHTRRGILRSMMRQHLDAAVTRGEPLAALWASEPGIYGRFGFGLANECHDVSIDSRLIAAIDSDPATNVSMILASDIPAEVAPFWSKVAAQRTGFIDRGEARWQDIIDDPAYRRGGGSASRHLVARRRDEIVGYAAYRQKSTWSPFGVPEGTIVLQTLVAADIEAHRALWAQVLNIDLFPIVKSWNSPVDDPLQYEVSNSRVVQRAVSDALYVRILDVETALTSRTYETDGELVIQIADELGYANGTYKIMIADGTATLEVSTATPDVSLDIRELGALYLGRACVDTCATMGLIHGAPDKVRTLGQLFATARAPWCPEMF